MKVTYIRCDFCGGKKSPSTPMARLVVPLSKEDAALRRKTMAEAEAKRQDRSGYAEMMFRVFGTSSGESTDTVNYDMCPECARGILMSRFREVRRALEMDEEILK